MPAKAAIQKPTASGASDFWDKLVCAGFLRLTVKRRRIKRLKCFASPKWCYRVSNNLGTYGREDMVEDLTLDPYGGLGVDPLTMRRSDLNPSLASRYVER